MPEKIKANGRNSRVICNMVALHILGTWRRTTESYLNSPQLSLFGICGELLPLIINKSSSNPVIHYLLYIYIYIYIYIYQFLHVAAPRWLPWGFYMEEIWSPAEHHLVTGLVRAMHKKLHFSACHKWFWKLILHTFIIASFKRIEGIWSISVQMQKRGAV